MGSGNHQHAHHQSYIRKKKKKKQTHLELKRVFIASRGKRISRVRIHGVEDGWRWKQRLNLVQYLHHNTSSQHLTHVAL